MKLLRFDSKVTEIIAIQITPTVDTEVYDIEVEDNHNFFANGVLTHNRLVASYNQYLYAWNAASSTYGSVLASHANSTKTTLTYDITTNIANYIDANGDLNFICDSQFTGGSITSADNLYYAECVVTYTLSSGNFLELF